MALENYAVLEPILNFERLRDAIAEGAERASELKGSFCIVWVVKGGDRYKVGAGFRYGDKPDLEPVYIWRCWEVENEADEVDLYEEAMLYLIESRCI